MVLAAVDICVCVSNFCSNRWESSHEMTVQIYCKPKSPSEADTVPLVWPKFPTKAKILYKTVHYSKALDIEPGLAY